MFKLIRDKQISEKINKHILKSIVFVLVTINVMTAFILSPSVTVRAADELRLYSKAAVLMDAESGRVLYGRCEDEQLAMASTTKIMTLIVTLENANLEDNVQVSSYAASMPDVQLNIREGEQYKLKDLLYSLMLESHNDSAVAIAEHVGGSVESFAQMMNDKAQEIGCDNTYFITPNGLDATDEKGAHSTTAKDLALIMSYCITRSPQKELFLDITRTQSYSFSDLAGKRSYSCNNHNAFLGMMEGALSGKTGFTNKAGYCYVGALKRENRTFVVALLACGWPNHKTYKWSDTRCLMEYGLENYIYRELSEAELPAETMDDIKVNDAQGETIGEEVIVPVKLCDRENDNTSVDGLLMKENEKITVRLERKKELEAPVNSGVVVGYLSYFVGNREWKRQHLVVEEDIEKIDFKWCVEKVLEKFINSDYSSLIE